MVLILFNAMSQAETVSGARTSKLMPGNIVQPKRKVKIAANNPCDILAR